MLPTVAHGVLDAWARVSSTQSALAKSRTGIRGLDEITGGGLPRGRTTLVTGGAGTGKTLLALQFLAAGARDYDEPGVLVTFEESAAKVSANVSSLGIDLDALQRDELLLVHSFAVDPSEIREMGEFDFEPLFLLLADSIERIGAKRVVLDTIEALFGMFRDQSTVRSELSRLFRWLEERQVTAIVTGERAGGLTRHGIEEFVSDCVIVLDHRADAGLSTRRLRVVKYRGSSHGTNEFPFVIGPRGFSILPLPAVVLNYGVSDERVSTGIDALDHMLGGGVYRGTSVLISGVAGSGKSTLCAAVIDAACARGEKVLAVLFEEAPDQVLRNMRSVGLDLHHWVESGQLQIWGARPSAYGLEPHLAIFEELLDESRPDCVVLDGIGSLAQGPSSNDFMSFLIRKFDLLKSRRITALATMLTRGAAEDAAVSVSSLADTWLLVRNVESNGERNRLLFVVKSRGSAHSNQVREFVLSAHGIDLIDVCVGPSGVLTGSARLAWEAAERDAEADRDADLERHQRELRRRISKDELRLAEVQEELADERADIERSERRAQAQAARTEVELDAMRAHRWFDTSTDGGTTTR